MQSYVSLPYLLDEILLESFALFSCFPVLSLSLPLLHRPLLNLLNFPRLLLIHSLKLRDGQGRRNSLPSIQK